MTHNQQRGLSLIELLLALMIGAFLSLAVAQVVVANKLSYLFQRALADNQSNASFTLQWLDRQLAKTGFKRRPDQPLNAAFPALSEAQTGVAGCAFEAGQVIRPAQGKALCIRYQPSDRQELDCLGNGRPANAASLSRPYAPPLEAYVEKLSINANQQLVCTSKDGAATLVEGIAEVRFDFGVGLPDSLKLAHYTATPAAEEHIRSVRFAALISTSLPSLAGGSSSRAWRYWYGTAQPRSSEDRLFQVVKGTTALRNLLP